MNYSNASIIRAAATRPLQYLYFWGHQPRKDGTIGKSCMSQWFAAPFTQDSIVYHTAEHWMMAEKARLFDDATIRREIQASTDPREVKQLGRQVKHFDETTWKAQRYAIVVAGNYLKFSQQPTLKRYLIGTKEAILVEASPYDRIWGIGLRADDPRAAQPVTWEGENLLGYALMEVRDRLKEA